MIHYQLRCGHGHEFDGWFKDSAGFDQQAGHHLVVCPSCGDVNVVRAMMAPAVATRRAGRAMPAEPQGDATATLAGESGTAPGRPPGAVAAKLPDHMRAVLQRMRAEVERNCDDVGERFAEEALRIHRGEVPARGIYGQATQDDAERLTEEGVEFAHLPWVPRADG